MLFVNSISIFRIEHISVNDLISLKSVLYMYELFAICPTHVFSILGIVKN